MSLKEKETSVDNCWYALYIFDGDPQAVGPFDNKRDAGLWLDGFNNGVNDNNVFVVIGLCSKLYMPFTKINIEKPAVFASDTQE